MQILLYHIVFVNRLGTKSNEFDLKTQFVPRSKHFSPHLLKTLKIKELFFSVIQTFRWVLHRKNSVFSWDTYKTYKYSVCRMYNFLTLRLVVYIPIARL